jgi:hypothetical protein
MWVTIIIIWMIIVYLFYSLRMAKKLVAIQRLLLSEQKKLIELQEKAIEDNKQIISLLKRLQAITYT